MNGSNHMVDYAKPVVLAATVVLGSMFTFFYSVSLFAADFYIDPVHGKDSYDGSADRPWKSLESLFKMKRISSRNWSSLPYKKGMKLVPTNEKGVVKSGDTIWLRSGVYGDLLIQNYYNHDFITIRAEAGHTPKFNSMLVRSSAYWKFVGLDIGPLHGKVEKPSKTMLHIQQHGWRGPALDIHVVSCRLRSIDDSSMWSAADWNNLAYNGIITEGTRMVVKNNRLKNVNFGIQVKSSHSVVENNVVENFSGDGLRGLGDYGVFKNNLVKNSYDVNENHDDGFQSWSIGEDGRVGTGVVRGITFIGNTIINYEDVNQPHKGQLQGIGGFDGLYEDWVIEDNLIIVDDWHGITLLGAVNSKVLNNKIVDLNYGKPGPPWIKVGPHKNGTPSRDTVVTGNIVPRLNIRRNNGVMFDNNMLVNDPSLMKGWIH